MNLTAEETQIVELLNSRIKENLDLARFLLKGLKTTQEAFFEKIGWDVLGIKKIHDCINPKFEIFILTDFNLDEYNKVITLPRCISTLIVRGYTPPTLPSNLPSELKILECHTQSLQNLPDNLPNSLITIYCHSNHLTSLPDNLPDKLEQLYCPNNQITNIPNLPNGLKKLFCEYNKHLSKFPEKLPDTLEELCCDDNHFPLTKMPSNLVINKIIRNYVK